MEDKITLLSNLNRELKVIEKQIVDRAIACLHIAEARLKSDDLFTTDYEVKATVEYYLNNEDEEPLYKFWHSFNYKETIIEKDYFLFLYDGNDKNWLREGRMPLLDEPYCYLMHDLMDHVNLSKNPKNRERLGDKIYDIDCIWVDVVYRDQREVRINGDGGRQAM